MKLTQIVLIGILFLASLLRFYKIDQIPHGLYIDEVSIGHNADTILHTGKDEYGVPFPLFFKAFGEYKMPVEIYLTSLSIAAFGKNDFAVRFPSGVAGVLSVLLTYLLVRALLKDHETTRNKAEPVALLSAFLLTITPWHIQFSRAGFEANTALCFYLLGGVLFLSFLKNNRYLWIIVSVLSFIVAAYTYNAYKLIVPVTLVFLALKMLKKVQKDRFKFGLTALLAVLLLLPLFLFSGGNARFLETSAFSGSQSLISYPMIYLQNYLSFFSLPFLFVTGDGFGRHTIVGMGPLFRWELPLLFVGLFFLIKERKTPFAKAVFFLFLLAPTTAALTKPSPHLLRSFLLVIPLTLSVSYGLITLWEKKKRAVKMLITLLGIFALYEFSFYLHLYYTHYPMRTALDWGYEYKAVIMKATELQKDYPTIVINKQIGLTEEYVKFYNDKLSYHLVDIPWDRSKISSGKIIYITTQTEGEFIGKTKAKHLQDIILPNTSHDIVAEFWEL